MNEREPIILDFSEAIAKVQTTCDHCGKPLGGRYMDKKKSMALFLDPEESEDGEEDDNHDLGPTQKEHHVCGEKCAHGLLSKRAENRSKKKKK